MRIIEIADLDNGAHRNQTTDREIPVPEGWAVIPGDMETPNFPFGEITVDDSTPPVVTSWTPGVMPEPEEPKPEPATDPVTQVYDDLAAAYTEGVNSAYEQ